MLKTIGMLLAIAVTFVLCAGCGTTKAVNEAGGELEGGEQSVMNTVYGNSKSVFSAVYETPKSETLPPKLPDSVRPPYSAPISDS
ncbi:hypothetical protein [Paenibacillus sp. GCM10027626]|uniref:hypothetical protein n=1 Tax=Paenibacillus sp. GCM10027626 TaxID=3273411 RepID=UPI003637BEDC